MADFSIGVGEALPYLAEKFLHFIGKDAATQEVVSWFRELQRVGLEESSYVQIVGMHQPIPIERIYRATRLQWLSERMTVEVNGEHKTYKLPVEPVGFDSLLRFPNNAIIYAGPGWGKTTFVRFVYLTLSRNPDSKRIPVLFTLRRHVQPRWCGMKYAHEDEGHLFWYSAGSN